MTSAIEREAIARLIDEGVLFDGYMPDHEWPAFQKHKEGVLEQADRIISEHISPLRSSLAVTELERDEAREEVKEFQAELQEQVAKRSECWRRSTALEALLAEAGKLIDMLRPIDRELVDLIGPRIDVFLAGLKIHTGGRP